MKSKPKTKRRTKTAASSPPEKPIKIEVLGLGDNGLPLEFSMMLVHGYRLAFMRYMKKRGFGKPGGIAQHSDLTRDIMIFMALITLSHTNPDEKHRVGGLSAAVMCLTQMLGRHAKEIERLLGKDETLLALGLAVRAADEEKIPLEFRVAPDPGNQVH